MPPDFSRGLIALYLILFNQRCYGNNDVDKLTPCSAVRRFFQAEGDIFSLNEFMGFMGRGQLSDMED